MTNLILIKHAKPQIETGVPAREWNLSDAGRASCVALARALRSYQPREIIHSLEPKAMQTAQLAAYELGVTSRGVRDLHEHERDAQDFRASQAEFESAVQQLFAQPGRVVFGRESGAAACARFAHAVNGLLSDSTHAPTIVVAHGTVISLYVAQLIDQCDGFALWRALQLPSFVALDTQRRKIIETWNTNPQFTATQAVWSSQIRNLK